MLLPNGALLDYQEAKSGKVAVAPVLAVTDRPQRVRKQQRYDESLDPQLAQAIEESRQAAVIERSLGATRGFPVCVAARVVRAWPVVLLVAVAPLGPRCKCCASGSGLLCRRWPTRLSSCGSASARRRPSMRAARRAVERVLLGVRTPLRVAQWQPDAGLSRRHACGPRTCLPSKARRVAHHPATAALRLAGRQREQLARPARAPRDSA